MRSRLIALAFVVVATLIAPGLLWASDDPPPTDGPAGHATPATGPPPATTGVTTPTAASATSPTTPAAPTTAPPPEPAPAQPATVAASPPPVAAAEHATVRAAAKTVSAHTAGSQSVTIKNFEFAPRSITVNVGDSIAWTNQDDVAHTATASDGSFDTGNLSKGQSGSHTFDTPGTYAYICSIHPSMKGTVVVRAAAATGSTSSSSGSSGTAGSGSSSTGSSGSSGSSGASTASASGSSASLPQTGLESGAVLALGALLLGAGVLLRRRLRAG